MKNRKNIIYVVIIIIILIIIIGGVFLIKSRTKTQFVEQVPNTNVQEEEIVEKSKYIMEESNNDFSARVQESDNKDFITLYLDTNIISGEKEINIKFNNQKYVLDTTQPVLAETQISGEGMNSSFNLRVKELEHFVINFLKKNVNVISEKSDIVLKIGE